MIGQAHIFIALVIVILSVSMLFYIFSNLQKLSNECQCKDQGAGQCGPVCEQMSSLTIPTMEILLIIGGFVIIISTTIYIILSK